MDFCGRQFFVASLCYALGICAGYLYDSSVYRIFWIIALPIAIYGFNKSMSLVLIIFFGVGFAWWYVYDRYVIQPEKERAQNILLSRRTEGENKNGTDDYLVEVKSMPLCEVDRCLFRGLLIGFWGNTRVHVDLTSPFRAATIKYGDVVSVNGRVKESQQKYRNKRIFLEIKGQYVGVNHLSSGFLSEISKKIVRNLYALRKIFVQRIKDLFQKPKSELLAGLIIEGGTGLPSGLKKEFNITGLSHIVALSGFNVTIILEAVFLLLSRFGRLYRYVIGTIFILSFAIMTGLSSPIIRASIMSLISVGADLTYRKYNSLRALFVSGLLLCTFSPLYLISDISFQLSFAASLGLILGGPILSRGVQFVGHLFGELSSWRVYKVFEEILATTLSAQLFVLPMIAYYMGSVSLISPISNVLVLAVIPWIMLGGVVSVILSLVPIFSEFVGLPSFFTNVLLEYVLYVVHVCAQLPYAAIKIRVGAKTTAIFVALTLISVLYFRKLLRITGS